MGYGKMYYTNPLSGNVDVTSHLIQFDISQKSSEGDTFTAEFDTDIPVTERRGNLVALVGEGVNNGTMRRVFGALDRAHLEPQSFQKQGITTILEFVNGAAKDAAQAIYREFFE
jgi:aspartokinase